MRRALAGVLRLVPRTEFSAHYMSTYRYIPWQTMIVIWLIFFNNISVPNKTIEVRQNVVIKAIEQTKFYVIVTIPGFMQCVYVRSAEHLKIIGFRDFRCLKYRPLSRYTETPSAFSCLAHGTFNCLQK